MTLQRKYAWSVKAALSLMLVSSQVQYWSMFHFQEENFSAFDVQVMRYV